MCPFFNKISDKEGQNGTCLKLRRGGVGEGVRVEK
jgi:hypothetical protein